MLAASSVRADTTTTLGTTTLGTTTLGTTTTTTPTTTGTTTLGTTTLGTTTLGTTTTTTTTTVPTTTPKTTTTLVTTTRPTTTTTATTTTAPISTTSTAPATIILNGHGWGHGIGMGQWGADGYAQHGWKYDAILAHYYTGTTLATQPTVNVRVLLLDEATKATINSAAPWTVTDSAGTTVSLPAGPTAVTTALTINGQLLSSPLTFNPGTAPLKVGSGTYRGQVVVTKIGPKLQVVNTLPLESYLLGVVPSEMPSTWPAEALKVQAVAARSYALATLTTIVTASTFDVYSDTRSQVYGGIAAETPTATKAVVATANQVVLYKGAIATTYFSSSTGGRSAPGYDALGKPVPYLVSVDDPYDTISPHHNWGPVLLSAANVAKAIKLPGQLVDLQPMTYLAGRVQKMTAVGSTSQLVIGASILRNDFGLQSTWFTVSWLSLVPQPAPLLYGATTAISGTVRGLTGVVLEERPNGAAWQTLVPVAPDSAGAFSVNVTPQATTQFRLTAGTIHAALIKVSVVPLVRATIGAGSVQGTAHPAQAGSPVELQLQSGTQWTTVATGTTDATGAFTISAQLNPGSYRVRCTPGSNLSPGVSALLSVP